MAGVWSFRTILKKAMAGVEEVEGVGTWSVMSVVNQVILHENAVRALVHGVWEVDVIVAPVLDAAVVQFMGEGVFHVCRVLFGCRSIIPLFIHILQTILPFLIGRNCIGSFFYSLLWIPSCGRSYSPMGRRSPRRPSYSRSPPYRRSYRD